MRRDLILVKATRFDCAKLLPKLQSTWKLSMIHRVFSPPKVRLEY